MVLIWDKKTENLSEILLKLQATQNVKARGRTVEENAQEENVSEKDMTSSASMEKDPTSYRLVKFPKRIIQNFIESEKKKKQSKKSIIKEFHPKGTGYGYNGRYSSTASTLAKTQSLLKVKIEREKITTQQLENINKHIIKRLKDGLVHEQFVNTLRESCLLPVLESFLRSSEMSILKTESTRALQESVNNLLISLTKDSQLTTLFEKQPDQIDSLAVLIKQQTTMAEGFFEDVTDEDANLSFERKVMLKIQECGIAVTAALAKRSMPVKVKQNSLKEHKKTVATMDDASTVEIKHHKNIQNMYVKTMSTLQFPAYKVAKVTEETTAEKQDWRTARRRLQRELRQLKNDLPIHFGSSIAVMANHKNPKNIQFLITGPQDTPYDSGCFVFQLNATKQYPINPPKVQLLTTAGGKVRFNPNLYATGKVCLSLLGTWKGPGCITWQPSQSTINQLIISIQSAILGVQYPYYNEPGMEKYRGTTTGVTQQRTSQNGGYEYLRLATINWAMINQLQNPPPGFEDFIKQHFLLKREYILNEVISPWLAQAKRENPSHYKILKAKSDVLRLELDRLGPLHNPKQIVQSIEKHTLPSKSIKSLDVNDVSLNINDANKKKIENIVKTNTEKSKVPSSSKLGMQKKNLISVKDPKKENEDLNTKPTTPEKIKEIIEPIDAKHIVLSNPNASKSNKKNHTSCNSSKLIDSIIPKRPKFRPSIVRSCSQLKNILRKDLTKSSYNIDTKFRRCVEGHNCGFCVYANNAIISENNKCKMNESCCIMM